ncbi:MAG: aminomethyl-transferring glycine dehydrogenase subunit GcvPA [Peptococcaceae bacterium]|nr:aminomethyl-transferring glycine dehydrogenase subunit GcvPA [Peptococcaceae bacterium]
MAYVPNPPAVRQQMLEEIGLSSMEELFFDIPEQYRLKGLDLGRGLSEIEIQRHLTKLAAKNISSYPIFLGAGAYDHHIPVAIDQILMRSEFYTAYTPYQPEISQGILQGIFEFQSHICALTGMDVSNASMYDAASALAEACNIAAEVTRRKKILVPDTVNPDYLAVLKTYAQSGVFDLVTVHCSKGKVGHELRAAIDDQTAAVAVQNPNFYGILEQDAEEIGALVHEQGGLFIMAVDPISLGLLKSPGKLGADLVVGEGQSLGMGLSYGGPYLGFFAGTDKMLRRIPGRIVGQTTDREGRRAFVLTLQAREQHIRRERASSNICSNQALNALAAAIFLSLVGPKGLRDIAERSHQLARYAEGELSRVGIELLYPEPYFREFIIKVANPAAVNRKLLAEGIIGGCELPHGLMLAFTEKRTKEEVDRLVAVIGGAR